MEVTEVRFKLAPHGSTNNKVLGYCSIIIGGVLVIHDVKLIDGTDYLFVSMPARRITDKCPCCCRKNHLRAAYCNHCGDELDPDRAGNVREIYQDITYPIVHEFRQVIEDAVIAEYHRQLDRSVPA